MADDKECYNGHFDCMRCKAVVDPEWRKACKRQCEYNLEHRDDHNQPPARDDDYDGYDIPGQFKTSY